MEKTPLLLLALLASALVFYTETRVGALASLSAYPLTVRISHALVSYLLYLGKMFWPIHLAVFYPHPGQWPLLAVGAATAALLAITFLSIKLIRRASYIAVGWFWYLGTMAPVIGFIQLGTQGMADRYTYISLIGIFVAIAWGVPALIKRWQKKIVILPLAALIVLSLVGYLGWRQAGYWQDAETLFRHALAVTDNNYLAYNNLGATLARKGKLDGAIAQYEKALHLKPYYVDAIFNMGQALADMGRFAEAKAQYRKVLELKPSFVEAHNNLGILLAEEGKAEEAVQHFTAALRIRPEYKAAGNNLRILLQEQLKKPAK